LAGSGPGQKEVGRVETGDEQNYGDQAEENQQRLRILAT
jgi:hypothetical protein